MWMGAELRSKHFVTFCEGALTARSLTGSCSAVWGLLKKIIPSICGSLATSKNYTDTLNYDMHILQNLIFYLSRFGWLLHSFCFCCKEETHDKKNILLINNKQLIALQWIKMLNRSKQECTLKLPNITEPLELSQCIFPYVHLAVYYSSFTPRPNSIIILIICLFVCFFKKTSSGTFTHRRAQ